MTGRKKSNKPMNSTLDPLFECVNCRASNFVTHPPIGSSASYRDVSE